MENDYNNYYYLVTVSWDKVHRIPSPTIIFILRQYSNDKKTGRS